LVLAKAFFALNDAEDAPGTGFPSLFTRAAFSRAACSFCAFRPSPPIFTAPALGMKSVMQKFSHASENFQSIFLSL
jgi:hypothetical protein